MNKNISDINVLIEKWTQAVRDEHTEGILENHRDSIVMFDVPLPLQSKGIEAYKATWNTFFTWSTKPRQFDLTELEIIASDTVAYAHAIGHCSGTDSKGVHETLQFRLTMGFQKIEGKWMIEHEHHSLPNEGVQ